MKLFIKETDEEISLGDVIDLTLTKDLEDGAVDRTVEVEVTENTLNFLLEMNIIEQRDEKLIDFCEECANSGGICPFHQIINDLSEEQDTQDFKLKDLELKFKNINNTVDVIRKDVSEILNTLTAKTKKVNGGKNC